MHTRLYHFVKKLLPSYLGFSVLTGFLSAIIVTIFKLAVEEVIHLSGRIYGTVRENPIWLPLLVVGAAAIGFVASRLLSISHSCRGGGIPTSISAVRGIVSFKWWAGITILPISALLTYLCGLPLGTEGPCVQMGTAIGNGVVKKIGSEKNKGWRRYIMTGGASAGFSIATSSPITAILFSMEELHKHFSPLLLTVAAISVITAQITVQLLALLGIGSVQLFHLPHIDAMDVQHLFVPLLVGLVCGVGAILFTYLYRLIDKGMHLVLKRLSRKIVFPILFACISIVGFFLSDALGTGHGLTDVLFETPAAWYFLLMIFLIRMVTMMISNTAGVTGGIFLPTIAFGAILGSLCAGTMISLGWVPAQHYVLIVALGITSFLGATSRIPVTACIFAIEALGGIHNILSIIIAITVSLLIVESTGLEDFTDSLVESKLHSISKGKTASVVEVTLTVQEDSFAVGKELRDILLPNACTVVSFERISSDRGKIGVAPGDKITVHYMTYDPAVTLAEFKAIVGSQSEETERIMMPASENG